MLEWILARDRFAHVLLTKADKLNRRDAQRVLQRDAGGVLRIRRSPRNYFPRTQARDSKEAREVMDRWLARRASAHKKRPRWSLVAATEADQPGMGMTNRVMPAQGEERGASLTLIWLDGDAFRKFQSLKANFSLSPALRQATPANRVILPEMCA